MDATEWWGLGIWAVILIVAVGGLMVVLERQARRIDRMTGSDEWRR